MIRPLFRNLLLTALLSTVVYAQAQDRPAAGAMPPRAEQGFGGRPSQCHPGPSMDELSKTLDLQGAQRDALKVIFDRQHQAMQQMHEEMRQKMETMHQQTETQINAVLTPAQQAKLKQLHETHRGGMDHGPGEHAGMDGHGPMHDGPPCPPAGPEGDDRGPPPGRG